MALLILGLFAFFPLDALCAETGALSEESSKHSVVFVIDVSTSMYDILDSLKSALKQYVRESSSGDSIAIVTFGESSKLHFRKTIADSDDVDKMVKFCDELTCPDEYTYFPGGLNKGIEELSRFYKEDPSGVHILVLLSDGKSNPPKDLPEERVVTYEQIKERYFSRFKPGRDWYISYVALRGVPDIDLAQFVAECRGSTIELRAEERPKGWRRTGSSGDDEPQIPPVISEARLYPGPGLKVEEDSMLNLGVACLPATVRIPLFIKPMRGKPAGEVIDVETTLLSSLASTRITAEVKPPQIVCGKTKTQADIMLSLTGVWQDELLGILSFRPSGSSILIIQPAQFQFRFEKPPRVIIGRYRPELGDAAWEPIERLDLGSLEAGGLVEGTLVLELEGVAPGREFKLEGTPNIELPSGVTCSADVDLTGILQKKAFIKVLAEAHEKAEIPEGDKWDGELVLKSVPPAIFSQNPLPLRVFRTRAINKPPDSTGIRSFYAKLPFLEWILENWKKAGLVGGGPALILLLLGAFGYLKWKAYASRFVALDGWLIILEKPQGVEIQNIDLKTLSQKLHRSALVIGSDPACDICVPKDKVDKQHAQLRSGREGTPTPVYIKPFGLSDVKVNHAPIDGEVKLQDRDLIDVGGYQFIYSNSHLKQVVVHYKDGDVRYGIPLTWNIEEEGFVLRPEGKGAEEMQAYIPFRDLKGVFFVKHFDKEIAKKMKVSSIFAHKDHVFIEFKDGEKIEGFTVQDYKPDAPRFFVVPKKDPGKDDNNICILVERRFARDIKLLARGTGSPAPAPKPEQPQS
jgi:pSer/pThr/pTyr-binding forkhead associated (FHA) protein